MIFWKEIFISLSVLIIINLKKKEEASSDIKCETVAKWNNKSRIISKLKNSEKNYGY